MLLGCDSGGLLRSAVVARGGRRWVSSGCLHDRWSNTSGGGRGTQCSRWLMAKKGSVHVSEWRLCISQGQSSPPGWHQQIAWIWPRVTISYTNLHSLDWDEENIRKLDFYQQHMKQLIKIKTRGLTLSEGSQAWRDLFTSAPCWVTNTQRKLSEEKFLSELPDLGESREISD